MRKLSVATGYSREDKSWKNQEITWQKLCNKLSKPVVTDELYADYMKMKGDQQMQIKDVGGFVGGVISGGRRVKGSCTLRSVVTLDIDQCSTDFIDTVQMIYGNTMLIHSTHKHSALTPRYRIVMPLNRDVLADEYEAIARKIAGNIGIETFDPTTFQPERLMFWPSVSKDMADKYEVHIQEGNWIDADSVLDEYNDWKDMSEWPVSEKQKKSESKHRGKQEDPTQKGGLIGVFCRAYGIEEAIDKFLPHVYTKALGHADRYTYVNGSTAAGVINYDNTFSFSYHSTDPTMGRLCNSFDLVRIHLYGDKDADIDFDKVPANKRPSFVKMTEMIAKDGLVKKTGLSEQLRALNAAFEDQDLEWTEKLETDKKGNILSTLENVVIIMQNDEALRGFVKYDDFDKRLILQKNLPWRDLVDINDELQQSDDDEMQLYFESNYKIKNAKFIESAINIVASRAKYHPVRDYLKSVEWDGVRRLDTLLIDYLGADDSDYVRAVTRKTFVAGVKRIFEPGCKFDTVLTLLGPQGLGKSRLLNSMGGIWYSDTFGSLSNNAAMENIQGTWLMEVGEMAGFKRAEVEAVKLFVAKQHDRFRVAFGKRVQKFLRQCFFVATTNDKTPLHDQSGGRRFWLVECKKKLGDNLKQSLVDQLWAEACYWYAQGESVFLSDEVESIAKEVQAFHTEGDDRESIIITYLNSKVSDKWYDMSSIDRVTYLAGSHEDFGEPSMNIDRVNVEDIWTVAFRGLLKDMTPFNTKFIRSIMNNMKGWEPNFYTHKSKSYRGWIRQGGVFDKNRKLITA